MSVFGELYADLQKLSDPESKKNIGRFFKTETGSYGESDRFIGVSVPLVRSVARQYYRRVGISEILSLLHDPIHECRLLALLIWVQKFLESDDAGRCKIYKTYISNTKYINNWDLVDLSAYQIVGRFLEKRDREPLYRLADSTWLWDQRISIVSTWEYIRKGDFRDTLALSDRLLLHPHDLIQKAVGWMLREVGKRDKRLLVDFLSKRYRKMPRTMLRYAIEKFDPEERLFYLKSNKGSK